MTAQKPLMPRELRALETAATQPEMRLYAFLPLALAFLDTILPDLLFMSLSFVKPPEVFTLVPRKTEPFARLPLAIFETRFALRVFFFVAFLVVLRAVFFAIFGFAVLRAVFFAGFFAVLGAMSGKMQRQLLERMMMKS